MKLPFAWHSGDSAGLNHEASVASVNQPQERNEVRLRLDRDHTGANPSENAYSITHVCTDVEGQITGLEELSVEGFHPATPPDRAVVGDERTGDSSSAADHVSR